MSADNRAAALDLVLESEGGYSDHPDDPGGPTNFGVTLETLTNWRDRATSALDVMALTKPEALAIFTKQYADKIDFDALPLGLDYIVLDFAVNSGPAKAVRVLQQQLGFVGDAVDGVVGVITLRAIDKAMAAGHLLEDYCDARLAFMKSLTNWSTFGKGWGARVDRVEKTGEAMHARAAVPAAVLLDTLAQAKAVGPVKLTATASGKVSIASVAATMATAGVWAAQASGTLSAFSDFGIVRYAMLGLAVITALGPLAVAFERTQNGSTT